MWQIASRHRPYEEAVPEAIPICVVRGEREEIVTGSPEEYMELVQQCWDHDPAKRPEITKILFKLSNMKQKVKYYHITPHLSHPTISCSNILFVPLFSHQFIFPLALGILHRKRKGKA